MSYDYSENILVQESAGNRSVMNWAGMSSLLTIQKF